MGLMDWNGTDPLPPLVLKLSEGDHPVAVGGPNPTLDEFRRRLTDLEYPFIKFTATKGGTDLACRLDNEATRLERADFEQGTGVVHVEGRLKLDGVPVTVVADIDVATLNGTGHLVVRAEDVEKPSEVTASATVE